MDKKAIPIKRRKEILLQLKSILIENEALFLQALQADLGKSQMEGYTSEIAILLNEIDYMLGRLNKFS